MLNVHNISLGNRRLSDETGEFGDEPGVKFLQEADLIIESKQ
jgi:hypothetical protein